MHFLSSIDLMIGAILFRVAIIILVSGLDDLFLDAFWLLTWLRKTLRSRRKRGSEALPAFEPEKRIAIFIPLWHEHAVIRGMVEHNVAAIHYQKYEFFIGAYPNDPATLDAVRDLEKRFARVHLAICPHDGPTSKADCLNWIYQRMLLYEEEHATHFDVVMTHDAEDIIHPASLERINVESNAHEMVQIPVLPLPTPLRKLVHGVYCDEFAEWQIKDMPARAAMGSFVPSNGVGTGYTRSALDRLANAEHNLVFEPSCLTEDYENGLRLHRLGCAQTFVPLRRAGGSFVATREYFPQTYRAAIRQRTRWATGIVLQTSERYGIRGDPATIYWFWRDRKGLLGNPLSLLTNVLFLYGLVTWASAHLTGTAWGLSGHIVHTGLLYVTAAIQLNQLLIRFGCSTAVYGWRFALGVPVRALVANYLNGMSAIRAIYMYTRARIRHEPLVWLKTEHAYPSRSALTEHKRRLGEVLVGSGYVSEEDLEQALTNRRDGVRLGEQLVASGKLTEEDLYEALSLQQSLASGYVHPSKVARNAARSIPREVAREWKVLPFQITSGDLLVASPEIPTDELLRTLRGYTRLSVRFQLVTPSNFRSLEDVLQ